MDREKRCSTALWNFCIVGSGFLPHSCVANHMEGPGDSKMEWEAELGEDDVINQTGCAAVMVICTPI